VDEKVREAGKTLSVSGMNLKQKKNGVEKGGSHHEKIVSGEAEAKRRW